MTLLIEDPLIEQLVDGYLLAADLMHKYGEALCAVAGKHDSFDCGPHHVLCCDDGTVIVRKRGES